MQRETPAGNDPVVVIGHVNHDRVWRLKEPLRPGGRIAWIDRTVRLGGGGYYTGGMLRALGRNVELVTTLADDEHGRGALEELRREGFGTDHVTLGEGETEFAEIFLDPTGERTILGSTKRIARHFKLERPLQAGAFYVNGMQLSDAIVASLDKAALVVSQFPLRNPTPRPADVIVGSRADFPGQGLDEIWQAARTIAGNRLKDLMLTDGPNEISVYDGRNETRVVVHERVVTADTIGAGDSFSGALLHELLNGMPITAAAASACERTADWLRRRDAATATVDPAGSI
ncbi:carbohydrate kinase [Rhizobium cremeum]|uniref:PfkB family carbohydrate kinase n=1 Tax=Rhizobium cremeum TaxID=2813827 RepID=UPI001FD43CF2|nr:PfkB family carbohydrate kinase [Rhizobium cremeum]MCJ7993737.1 carbohydrate kinase [Rhizobium cremeum]MCJ7998794.1 carbohydrate kinase [Rhizobium cremeum]